jgi:small subunit ribosomal protein S17
MAKTIVVRVERRFPHPRNTRRSSPPTAKFYAHDEKSEAKVGDRCDPETRPLSKTKRWR